MAPSHQLTRLWIQFIPDQWRSPAPNQGQTVLDGERMEGHHIWKQLHCKYLINHNSHHNIPSSSQRHSRNPCWHSTSPPPRRSRSGDQFNYYQCCPNNCQDQAFSYGTNPKAHLICAVCLGTHTQCLHMQHLQNMGWPSSNNGQKVQRWPSLMREWHAHLYGLAKTLRMH